MDHKKSFPQQELNSISGKRVSNADNQCFQAIQYHRNRLMHFFHEGYSQNPKGLILQEIVIEQCKGWYYLYKWLTEDWKEYFKSYTSDITKIQQEILSHIEFLKVKYDNIKPRLEKYRSKDYCLSTCHVCRFRADVTFPKYEWGDASLRQNKCLVCDNQYDSLRIPCPSCNEPILIYSS